MPVLCGCGGVWVFVYVSWCAFVFFRAFYTNRALDLQVGGALGAVWGWLTCLTTHTLTHLKPCR